MSPFERDDTVQPEETPVPPKTKEFGACEPNGPILEYPQIGTASVSKRSVGRFDNGVYLIRCTDTNESLLIDGASETELLLDLIGDSKLIGIAQTHGHPDHVGALKDLLERFDVPVFAHPGDAYPVDTRSIDEGDDLKIGTLTLRVLHTPGHTPGSVTFAMEGRVFTGDTLFPGGPGATFGSDEAFDQIMVSVDRLMDEFDDDLPFSPGHGHDSRFGLERPHVETWRRRRW